MILSEIFYTKTFEIIRLGELLGKGAEGSVYAVANKPDSVAKIYLNSLSTTRKDKLCAMISIKSPEIEKLTAWPSELLFRKDGTIGGFLMPKIESSKDIHCLYGPKSRLTDFPTADWRLLVRVALNTAKAFYNLHESGYLIADVNHGGIRVAPNGTVRLIDCDSFQINLKDKIYLCEVGTDQFTPPELQGSIFRETPRTSNHDNFGLAVLIFLLLQMGRHPFAGRYQASGEMPIPKAIREFRYAYSARNHLTKMAPPPHAAKPEVSSPQAALLWEKAFSVEGTKPHERPTPKDWIDVLTNIEKNYIRCANNASHFYFASKTSCPWCPIESMGVILFGTQIHFPNGRPTNLDILSIWKELQKFKLPDEINLESILGTGKPSKRAAAHKRKRDNWKTAGFFVGFVILLIGISVSSKFLILWLIVAFVSGYFTTKAHGVNINEYQNIYASAQKEFANIQNDYNSLDEVNKFKSIADDLKKSYSNWQSLDKEREKELEQLTLNKKKLSLDRYLDRHRIRDAKIHGIGPAKSSMLESYGIETASDFNYNKLIQVPGFGPALISRLLYWQNEISQRFVFNPKSEIDERDIRALNSKIEIKRTQIENKIRGGPQQLKNCLNSINRKRTTLKDQLEKSFINLNKAKADLDLLR